MKSLSCLRFLAW